MTYWPLRHVHQLGMSPDAGLSLDYAFTPQFHGSVGFNYRHFEYGQSPVSRIDFTVEPASKTDYYIVKAGVGYSFYQPAGRSEVLRNFFIHCESPGRWPGLFAFG